MAGKTRRTKKRGKSAVSLTRKPRGKPFAPGNQAGKGHGRPKKDWDIETEAKALTPAILARFAVMGANARSPHDVAAGKVVIAYAEGLPKARTEHSGPGGKPISVRTDEGMTTEEMRRELANLMGEKPADDNPGEAGDDDPDASDDEP